MLTAPVLVPVVPVVNRTDIAWPKRISLPSRLPADGSTPSAVRIGLPDGLRPVDDDDADDEKDRHRRQNRASLADVADHAAEGENGGDRDQQQGPDLQHVGPGVGVLERMRRIGVEEAAAVGAELLDDLLARHRPDGNGLLRPFQRGRVDGAGERLRHAERDEDESEDERDRQEDVKGDARHIDPEIADSRRATSAQIRAPARRPSRGRSRQTGSYAR